MQTTSGSAGPGREGVELDTHREGVGPDDAVGQHDLAHLVLVAQDAADALEEVLGVVVGVKADEIGPEHPLQERRSPVVGQQAEESRRTGRGCAGRSRSCRPGRRCLSIAGSNSKMVVVDPDEVAGPGHLQDRVAEHSVDAFVGGPGVLVDTPPARGSSGTAARACWLQKPS